MATEPTGTEERAVRPLASVLQELLDGRVHTDASVAMQDLVDAVHAGLGKGSVTLQFTVEPSAKGKSVDSLMVSCKVTTKIPQPEVRATTMFVGKNGALTRTNPGQQAFEGLQIAEVPPTRQVAAPAAVRFVGGGEA
jgi:hypothetical protein